MRTHTESAAKRREPGIVKLATTYNDICRQIQKLIASGRAPAGALTPQIIARDGLFKLDVDDDVWQDVGLEDDDYRSTPPRWLSDDKVRRGIAALLEHDRSQEEEHRLGKEKCAMQEWFSEEWRSVEIAKDAACELAIGFSNALALIQENLASDAAMLYHLDLKAQSLCRLCVTWQAKIAPIRCPKLLDTCWGPTERQLRDAAAYEVTADWGVIDESSKEDGIEHSAHEEYEDDLSDGLHDPSDYLAGELLDSVEVADLADAYRDETELYLYFDRVHLSNGESSRSFSTPKRAREE